MLSIIPMQTIEVETPGPIMTYMMNFGMTIPTGHYFWLIKGVEKEILIDAGVVNWMESEGFSSKHLATPEELLGEEGLRYEDIDIIIITHLMGDHVEYLKKYKNAKVIVQRKELDWALNPHPLQAKMYEKKFLEGVNFTTVDGDIEIVDGVRVMLTPGHSPGGQSVAVNTAHGVAIITGFCCIQENLQVPTDIRNENRFILPGVFINAIELWESIERVITCSDLPIAVHDPKWGKLKQIPS